jgi:cysteine desulfurase
MKTKQVYLDYNATTPVAPQVISEMLPFIQSHFGNPSSSYGIGRKNKDAIEKARLQLAGLLGSKQEEIIFTSGGTESNNHAIRGIAMTNQKKGKHIITSQVEHPAVTEVCSYLEKKGYEISRLPVDSYGKVNPEDVEKAIRSDTILITIMHANNETGTIQPVEEIGEIAKNNGVIFHTDAAQSVGKIKTNVNELNVDLLSVAGHKLYAPKGIGALFIRDGISPENLMFGAGQENGLRPGTENVPYIVALGKACELANENLETNNRHLFQMRQRLLDGLKTKCQTILTLNANLGNCLPNTLSVAFEGINAHTLASLVGKKVLFSTGSACHADSVKISPVLKAMRVNPRTAASTVRISTGKYTTEEEVERAVETISDIVNRLL